MRGGIACRGAKGKGQRARGKGQRAREEKYVLNDVKPTIVNLAIRIFLLDDTCAQSQEILSL